MPALRPGETTAPTSAAQGIQPESRSATAQVITPSEQSPTLAPTATLEPTPTRQPLPPALVEVDPPVGTELPLTLPIKLYFNQAMDQQIGEAGLKLVNFSKYRISNGSMTPRCLFSQLSRWHQTAA